MGRITIQDIATTLVERHGLGKKEALAFLNVMFDTVQQGLERDRIAKVKGLGVFKIIDVEARESVNVNTGERVLIEGHQKITFTPDALMKELVNKPFSQFETVVLNEGVDFDETSQIPSERRPSGNPVDTTIGQERQLSDTADADPATMPLVDFGDATEEAMKQKPEEPVSELLTEETPEWVIEPYVPTEGAVSADQTEPVETASKNPSANADEAMETPATDGQSVQDEPQEMEKRQEEKTVERDEETSSLETGILEQSTVEMGQNTAPKGATTGQEASLAGEPEPLGERTEASDGEKDSSIDEGCVDGPRASNGKVWLIAVVACLIGLVGGYVIGTEYPLLGSFKGNETEIRPVSPVRGVAKISESRSKEAKKPATNHQSPSSTAKKQPVPEVKGGAKSAHPGTPMEAKPEGSNTKSSAAQETSSNVKLDKYEAADARIRTGAYRIVGTERVFKVRKGDDIARIARLTLGPDMDCYIEAYNGLKAGSELKVGQEIKIPKLELKKRRKAQTMN